MAAASIAMVARLLEILTSPASKENHHQDPEEFYVKQDRIGAPIPHGYPVLAHLIVDIHTRQGLVRRGLQGVRVLLCLFA